MATTTLGIKVDRATRDRLKRLADLRERSAHWLMKEAIARYLDEEEHYEVEKAEDMARWARYLETGSAVPHEEVGRRLAELKAKAAAKARSG